MSLETAKSIFEWVGVVLLFLSFVSGAGVLFTSNKINERQAERLRQFDKDLTTSKTELGRQQERAASAEGETERLRLEVAKANERIAGWRLDAESQKKLVERLKPFSGTSFDLVTDPSESRFMNAIDDVLTRAGWTRLPARQPDGRTYTVIVGGKAGAYVGAPGINIETVRDSFDRFGQAFSALSEGLVSVGIPAKPNIVRTGEGDARAIHIVIGKME